MNLRQIILDERPSLIVEVGAGNGDNTRLLSHLMNQYSFELHVISDKKVEGLDPRIKWTVGISYAELSKYSNDSIGLCIIDTDHNYWTLCKEIEAVKDKITKNGFMAFHDVDEFYHNTGMAMSYWDGHAYHEKEIMECVKLGGVGDALLRFLVEYKTEYKLIHWTKEKFGAALIQRHVVNQTAIITPAGIPVFSRPYTPDGKPL